jgi:hypothetical protein
MNKIAQAEFYVLHLTNGPAACNQQPYKNIAAIPLANPAHQ